MLGVCAVGADQSAAGILNGLSTKTLQDVNLGQQKEVFKVTSVQSTMHAFKLMTTRKLSGLPVVSPEDGSVEGTMSWSDLRVIVSHGKKFDFQNTSCLEWIQQYVFLHATHVLHALS